ncbi:MAG: efflux RND transporter periplasmic adaptor subunit [Bacteroidetes bacterium]|nr:efflux RND transporter periplasmic adaptor subunit [Bacteroidota bacterium]
MNKKTRNIIIIAIVLLVAGMIVYPFIIPSRKNETNKETNQSEKKVDRTILVNAQVIKYETMTDRFLTIGSILPGEEVNLSFETTGKIVQISFQEGTNVKKGQLLAKVNDELLQAELKKLKAQIPLAEAKYNRQKTLLEKDIVSKEAFEQVATDLETLNADIELVRAKIALTELKAPFDGVIGLRFVSEGQYVDPTTKIAVLTMVSPLKIEFSINERQASSIQEGTKLKFHLQDDLQVYEAVVYAVESILDVKTRTLKVRALYPNINGKLKPGRSCSIEIQLKEINNTIAVPSEAVIAELGNDIAYIYRDGKAEQVKLTKGMRTENKLQILKGINVGDTLITTGTMQLREGSPVNIMLTEE